VIQPAGIFQRYYNQLDSIFPPEYRCRSFSTIHQNHHDAYQHLLREGGGRLGFASSEAWSQASMVAPYLRTTSA
jgi:hypothetical protein